MGLKNRLKYDKIQKNVNMKIHLYGGLYNGKL